MARTIWMAASAVFLALVTSTPLGAETSEQVQQRLEQYRQQEADAARRVAEKAAADAERRRQTLERIERQKADAYARNWKRYGNWEVNIRSWKQLANRVWVADAKFTSDQPSRFDASLDALVREGVVSPEERSRIHQAGELKPVDLPTVEARGVVRFGDTLLKLAQRYGLTLQELLRLNPGLEGARLVAGTEIQLAQSAPSRPRLFQTAKTTTSGGGSSSDSTRLPPSDPSPRIAVDCRSLTVSTKLAGQRWAAWQRPDAGEPFEQLLVDRCSQEHAPPTR